MWVGWVEEQTEREGQSACKENMQAAGGMQVFKSTAVYFKM